MEEKGVDGLLCCISIAVLELSHFYSHSYLICNLLLLAFSGLIFSRNLFFVSSARSVILG